MVNVVKASPKIGAEIQGVNVKGMDNATFRAVYQAFLDYIVIVIRGQDLSEQDFIDFSARFGEIKPHMTKKAHHPRYPELMLMDNRILDTRTGEQTKTASPLLVRVGNVWHTDTSYEYVTAKVTGMYAINVPSVGGDTLFTNMYAAYDALPDTLKQKLEGRAATHIYGGRLKRQQDRLEEENKNRAPAIHPMTPVHPETGRRSLYFNDGQIMNIIGFDQAESDAVIADLAQRTASEDGDYRHKWQRGDVVIWDNRCSIHCATGNYPANERRTNWRSTVMEFGWKQQAAKTA